MRNRDFEWFGRFLPQPNTASFTEQMRSSSGALFGLMLTGVISFWFLGNSSAAAYLVAPMGASAVLLFAVPSSPLAQPWSIVGGNLVSSLIGVSCAKLFPDAPLLAAALAGGLAIAAMFPLRCLHPPSGAVALTAVLGGPAVHEAGYRFVLMPVELNSVLLVSMALFFNNATGRRYPHSQHSTLLQNIHDTKDVAPTVRLGFTSEDLDAVLKHYDQVLDISRDDLEDIIIETEMQAYRRRFGVITCGDIMSKDAITLEFSTELREAWRLMRRHQVHALPVLSPALRVIGIVSQSDFLKHKDMDEYRTMGQKFRHFISRTLHAHSSKPEIVGQIMTQHVKMVTDTTPIIELVPLMANTGLHHIPLVDAENRFVGIVTQSDMVAALYESRLAERGALPAVKLAA